MSKEEAFPAMQRCIDHFENDDTPLPEDAADIKQARAELQAARRLLELTENDPALGIAHDDVHAAIAACRPTQRAKREA